MNFKEYAIPALKEVFDLVDEVCSIMNIELYLIGAQARDIHFLEKGIKPPRGTRDIDFAIMLPEMETYEKIKDELINRGFRKVSEPKNLIPASLQGAYRISSIISDENTFLWVSIMNTQKQ